MLVILIHIIGFYVFKENRKDVYSIYYFDQHFVIHGEMDIRLEIQGKQTKACSINQ